MQLLFLGTSSMMPTKDRNQMGVLLSYGSEGILFDCGEGMQRQIKIAGEKITKITKILISHWHGDHVLGLPGLIQSLSASEYNRRLEIYGPKGTRKRIENLFNVFVFDRRLEMKVKEIVKEGIFFENDDFELEAGKLEHGIETLGFCFRERQKRRIDMDKVSKLKIPVGPLIGKLQDGKTVTFNGKNIKPDDVSDVIEGKSIAYITDTSLCNGCYKLAKSVDLLICEATYTSNLEEKSESHYHLTAKQAALLANKANAKKLVLVHFSSRYKTTDELQEEARTYFSNAVCAYDFMKVNV